VGRGGQQEPRPQARGEGLAPFLTREGGGAAHLFPECWKQAGPQSLAVTLSHTASSWWPELNGALHNSQEQMLRCLMLLL
jgi:hypothetical protein